jgi:hypothetical protein
MKLVDDQRAALGILAASVRGRPESLMLAHGFAIGMLRGLVRDGLAYALREPAYFNRRAVLVTVMQITDAGRRALDESCRRPRPCARRPVMRPLLPTG